jgi:hypothetical protein
MIPSSPTTSTTKKTTTTTTPTTKHKKKHVTFAIDDNDSHHGITQVTDHVHHRHYVNPKDLWYTKQDIYHMKQQFKEYLYTLQVEHKQKQIMKMTASSPSSRKHETTSSIVTWYRAYRTCAAPTAKQVYVYPLMDVNHVGAERLAVGNILQDISQRRQALVRIAAATTTNTSHRLLQTEQMAHNCRTISRPSRLYAIHVAKASLLMDAQ